MTTRKQDKWIAIVIVIVLIALAWFPTTAMIIGRIVLVFAIFLLGAFAFNALDK